MAQSEALREFFVSISYKLDESSERKFKHSVEGATKMVAGMAAAVVAMAAAVEAAVVKVARDFDQIYWSTQRVGASAANVRAFGYALSQVGGSADAAQSSLEKFASALRTNPGYKSWLTELGVSTSQGGKARDSIDEMIDLVDVLSKKYSGSRYGIGASIASQFGIDENTYFQISTNRAEFERRFRESKSKNAAFGFDPDKAAQSSRALMSELRDLAATLDTLKDKILIDLGPSLTKTLQDFNAWIIAHKDDIVAFVRAVMEAVKSVVEDIGKLVEALKPMGDAFDQMTQKIVGEKGLHVALEALTLAMATTWLTRLTGFAGVLNTVLGRLGLLAVGMYAFKQQLDQVEGASNPTSSSVFGDSAAGQWLGSRWWGKAASFASTMARYVMGGGKVKAISSEEQHANAMAGYIQLRKAGFTHEMAIGVLSNISAESGFNPSSRGDGGQAHGIAQWHPDRRAAILAGTGIDVSSASYDDQIKALIWEMQHGNEQDAYRRLIAATSPEQAAAIVSQFYERPADAAGAAADRMGRAADLKGQFSDADLKSDLVAPPSVTNSSSSTSNSLNSTVNLYGAYDKDTGNDIQRRVEGSWDLLMRNGQGAVR